MTTQPTTARANNPQAAADQRLALAPAVVKATALNIGATGAFRVEPRTWFEAAAWFVSTARVMLANALLVAEGGEAQFATDCDISLLAGVSPTAEALIEALQGLNGDSRAVLDETLVITAPPTQAVTYHKGQLTAAQRAENLDRRIGECLRNTVRADAFAVLSANGRAAGAQPMARLSAPARRAVVIQDDDIPLDLD